VGGSDAVPHDTQTERWVVWFLLAVTVTIYLGSAGIPALLDDADALFAEIPREMNLRHDWITPYANAIRFLEKPPLLYWLIALSYIFCGVTNAFTARLPTALMVVALVFVTYKIGERLFGRRAGLFGGLALSTAFGTFLFTRIILQDILLTLILTLFVYTLVRWRERAAPCADTVAPDERH
jgi:4-amino-4-deoxy-L-arabinose transferase-like glycosyltransferase